MEIIDPIEEAVSRHNDAELVQYLYNRMQGVNQAFKKAVSEQDDVRLWASVGDIAVMTKILHLMNKRNLEKLAASETR